MKTTQRSFIALVLSFCLLWSPRVTAMQPPGLLAAWGSNSSHELDVPSHPAGFVGVSAGYDHSLALTADGTIVGWGGNAFGQTNVPQGLSNVVSLAAGYHASLALLSGGSLLAWGSSDEGVTNIPAGLSNVVAIAASRHALALQANGTVLAWGWNGTGATNVPSDLVGVTAVAAGMGALSMALKTNGQVIVWGWNSGTITRPPASAQAGVSAIAAGEYHCLALKSNGTVIAWGDNSYGQTDVPKNLSNVVAIAAGTSHNLALKSNGTVVAWGRNIVGQANVPSWLSGAQAVSAGHLYSLALQFILAADASPPSSIQLPVGQATNLAISVRTGGSLTYQWYFNSSPIQGATGTNLMVDDFSYAKAGNYTVQFGTDYTNGAASCVLRLENSPAVLVDGVDAGGGPIARVDSTRITMTNTGSGSAVYFTLDGSTPQFTSIPYTGPFTLTNSATIRAIAFNRSYADSAEAAPIAVEIRPTYPLLAAAPGGGSVSISPAPYTAPNRYLSNTVVTLIPRPANGWSFMRWTGDATSTSDVMTVLMDRPHTVQAVFGTSLNLFTNGSGQIRLNPAVGPYAFGSPVTLAALASPGSYFFGWAGAATGFANPLSITATNAAGITALFGELNANQVSLTVLPNGDGSVSASPAKNVYTNGETVQLLAVPAQNSAFTGWSDGASGSLNPLTLTLTGSTVITANFAPGPPIPPPVITHPPPSRTLSPGASTVFSLQMTGEGPFAYQWRFNSSPVPGATNPMLTLSNVTTAYTGLYDVIVAGAGGAVTSAPASLALFGLEWAMGSGGPQPLLVLDAPSGVQYRLEYSWNLSQTNWSLLAPVTSSGSSIFYVDIPDTNFLRRFYRAVPQ